MPRSTTDFGGTAGEAAALGFGRIELVGLVVDAPNADLDPLITAALIKATEAASEAAAGGGAAAAGGGGAAAARRRRLPVGDVVVFTGMTRNVSAATRGEWHEGNRRCWRQRQNLRNVPREQTAVGCLICALSRTAPPAIAGAAAAGAVAVAAGAAGAAGGGAPQQREEPHHRSSYE